MITAYKKTSKSEAIVITQISESGTWINVSQPGSEEIDQLSREFNIDFFTLKTAVDSDEKPRLEADDYGNVFILIRPPAKDESNQIIVLSLTIIITPKNIITISTQPNPILNDFISGAKKDFYTTKKTRFVLQILNRTNSSFQKILNQIERDIDQILLTSFKNEEIVSLLGIQKSLVYFNTAVLANGKVLERIMKGNVIKLYAEDADLLSDIIIENQESIEMVNIFSNILSNTMDAYASIISNNLNIVMKFLTSFTIILAFPTIVASLYGMNVGLPLQNNPLAFIFIIMISLFLMGTATWIFVKRNFF